MKPEQQWQFDELFSDYEAEIKARENAEKEVIEQCRLNAMGSEREAKLMAELAAKTQECERLKAEEPKGWVEYRKLEASEAEIADLRDIVERLNAELAEARRIDDITMTAFDTLEGKFKEQVQRAEQAEARLRDSCLEGRGDQEFPPCARAIEAESRAAALEEALSQMLDDMGVDGLCVCPAAKEQAIAAMGGRDEA
jgi:chromosome segregation ATPase